MIEITCLYLKFEHLLRHNMGRIILTSVILLFTLSGSAYGQTGSRQAGLRLGYRGGIYYQALNPTGNAETGYLFMAGFHNHGIQFTGLKVMYEMALSEISPDLILGWGYGGHAGFIFTNHIEYLWQDYYFYKERFCPVIGIDGWGTAEYRFRKTPMIVSLNVKPFIELTIPTFVKIMPFDFAISVAYTF
jgi:hypothetical protein